MPIEIKIRQDLSIHALTRLRYAGYPIPKTPHWGNFYPNNLAFAQLGFEMLCVDHTIGSRDTNFHPHCIVAQGTCEKIASGDVMTPLSRVYEVSRIVPRKYFPLHSLVGEGHLTVLRTVFPQAHITRYSTFLKEHRCMVERIFNACSHALRRRTFWTRYLYDNGMIGDHRGTEKPWSVVQREGILGLTYEDHGWVPPNAFNIVVDMVINSQRSDHSPDVYHCSGPDMYRYIHGMQRDLSRLYDTVRKSIDPQLPEHLTLHLPAVHNMRFAVRNDRSTALCDVFDAYSAYLGGGCPHHLRDAISACPDIMYDIQRANFMSQHDLLTDHSLFIHPQALTMTFQECDDMMTVLDRVYHDGPRGYTP